jgi:hypothetical protein
LVKSYPQWVPFDDGFEEVLEVCLDGGLVDGFDDMISCSQDELLDMSLLPVLSPIDW